MKFISNVQKEYLNPEFARKIFFLLAWILFWASFNVNGAIAENKNPILISKNSNKKINQNSQTTIESKFTEAFYRHTRPYHFDNDISAKIRNLLTISTGGTKEVTFTGIGFREKSIEWDGLAIENTYREIMESYYSEFKVIGADIQSIFNTSLSSEQKN